MGIYSQNDFLDECIKSTIESSNRVRNFLIIAITASLIVIIPVWNVYLDKNMSLLIEHYRAETKGSNADEANNALYLSEYIKKKIDSNFITIPGLQIEMHSNNFGIIRGISIFIIMILIHYSLMRQLYNAQYKLDWAKANDCLPEVNFRLAMGQVLTFGSLSEKRV